VTQPLAPNPDPTLELAERQLALLDELGRMAMAVAEAFTESAIASAKAEKRILADEYFVPEVGRARACGAKDASESFQKASRAVRLTFMLQMNLAEIVRDIRAGHVTYLGGIAVRKDAGETPAVQGGLRDRQSLSRSPSRDPDGASSDDRAVDSKRRDSDTEHLIDIERPDTLFRAPFRPTVEHISGDVCVTVDWTTWRLTPPDWTETRPPAHSPAPDPAGVADRCRSSQSPPTASPRRPPIPR
jgi:hypothetical protein